jgi:hypothetical protein
MTKGIPSKHSQRLTDDCLGVSNSSHIPGFQCARGGKVVSSTGLVVREVAYSRHSRAVSS